MTDQKPEVEVDAEHASTNFYWAYGKEQVFNLQTTIRGIMTPEQVEAHLASAIAAMKAVVQHGGRTKQVGQQAMTPPPHAQNGSGAAQSAPGTPGVPLPLQASPAPAEGGTAICAMIEIGTAYTSGKTQLKFHCDGFENPLTYTKGVEEMVKMLAPLGFTLAHIVIGQKYPVSALVRWVQKGEYKNVLEVHAK